MLFHLHPLLKTFLMIIYYNYWTDFPTLGCILANKKTISRFHGYDVYFERHPFNYLPFEKNI